MSENTPLLSEKTKEKECGDRCRCGERPHPEPWHGYLPKHVADMCMVSAVIAIPVAMALLQGFEFLQNWMAEW
jgi:hypothetical protein